MLEQVKGDGPLSMIIRHAERNEVGSIAHSLEVGLTGKGKQDAIRFGGSIGGDRPVRLFHSPAVRCRETAMGIAEGLRSNGHEVISVQESPSLCAPYLKDTCVLRDADRLGHDFMRAWFEGRFDRRWLLPTPEAADMVLSLVIESLGSGPEDGLDIHVSHDWEVVLLREELLGVRYEEAGWVEYLAGLVLTPSDNMYTASCPQGDSRFAFRSGRRCRADQGQDPEHQDAP
jgi:hypothetical protein